MAEFNVKTGCQRHLLACFDMSGDQGSIGGLVGGLLYDVNEIEQLLHSARLAWVQSVRNTGKRTAPRWIMKERGLLDYFQALGPVERFDLEESENDEDAAYELATYTDNELWHAREEFLWDVLHNCGWLGERTEELFDSFPGLSTTYLSWWANKPRDIAKRLRERLKKILLEAKVSVKSPSRAQREWQEIAEKGVARLLGEPSAKMAKTAGTKKGGRASKRKSTRRR